MEKNNTKVLYRATLTREPFTMLYVVENADKHYMSILDNPDDKWDNDQEWKEVDLWYNTDGSIFWYKNKK